MKNIKLTLEYDGSNYYGWQKQDNLITIEGQVQKAINYLLSEDIDIIAAGRTDRGVHAYGQVINIRVKNNVTNKSLLTGINHYLTKDQIQVVKVEEAREDFHSRFSAKGKMYKYILNNEQFMHPAFRNYKGHIPYYLDLNKILECSKLFLGRHNFTSFSKNTEKVNPIRQIDKLEIHKEGNDIIFYFEAESFLRNMIRIIIGSLVEVGRGKRDINWIKNAFKEKNRVFAGPTIAASGLYLMEIYY
ncbi:tRNA pseudouridine(38-40) synthase TruA [Miniphocaeibacter massiliensis]|uniref:tRNA pseudouridine(38-40) synthase TruA n=1 Tax=Miniphocaeibacter massiliensis TaxID=2041841 RepID=UPI000C1BF5C3|nr:tRNA pseudouridine(38-40) synthase TruA [Miniphocaeibacter massiliensis]